MRPSGSRIQMLLMPRCAANGESGEWHQREQQNERLKVVGVEDRDDGDRQQVIHHRQGEQEGAQGRRQAAAHDGEHGHGEGDVRCRGDGPPAQGGFTQRCYDRHVDQRRERHATDCRRDGQGGGAGLSQLAGDEFLFELKTDDEEEDREKSIGGPRPHREVQVQGFGTEGEVANCLVERSGRGVRQDEREHCRAQQQRATDGVLLEGLVDATPQRVGQLMPGCVIWFVSHEAPFKSGRRSGRHRCHPPTRLPGTPPPA